jgi:hypothetical protein
MVEQTDVEPGLYRHDRYGMVRVLQKLSLFDGEVVEYQQVEKAPSGAISVIGWGTCTAGDFCRQATKVNE